MENKEELHIYSEEVRDVLSTPPKSIFRVGNSIVFIFVFIIFLLGWLIKYPDLVVAEGTLTTKIPPERIYARSTGRIDSIFVADNAKVKKREDLAVIENTAEYESVKLLKSIVDTLQIQQLQFNFPYEKCNNLELGSIAVDYANFENDLRNYQQLLSLNPYLIEKQFQKNEVLQQNQRLQNLRTQLAYSEQELELERNKLNRNKDLEVSS